MNKLQFKPEKKKRHKNILHYVVYIVRPFYPSIAIATFDTVKQVCKFLDIYEVNYAKNKFIKELGYNKEQLFHFYKTYDRIYDINLRLTVHIQNFRQFIKPLENLNNTYIVVTKTHFNRYNNKK